MLGQQPPCGTGDCEILLDEELMMELVKDKKPIKLDDIKEESDDEDSQDCTESDIAFNFKVGKNTCYNINQEVKVT